MTTQKKNNEELSIYKQKERNDLKKMTTIYFTVSFCLFLLSKCNQTDEQFNFNFLIFSFLFYFPFS